MRIGNFDLTIPQGGREQASGHIEMAHGTQYSIRMTNHWPDRRCDATVTVDGKDCGSFRLNAGGGITLERPSNDHGKFTFYRADSSEGEAAGSAKIDKSERGLVQVTFRVEKERPPVLQHTNVMRSRAGGQSLSKGVETEEKTSGMSFAPGVTGLSGHSNQSFVDVAPLDYDPTMDTVITLRLVCGPAVRELTPVAKANPVPRAVE